jgi:hypothetical protein
MMISSQYNQIQTMGVQATQQKQAPATNQTNSTTHTDKVTLSSNTQQMQQTERDIANRYDVNNMSEKDLANMADELKSNGMIDSKQHLMMSFEHSKIMSDHFGFENKGGVKRDMLNDKRSELTFAKQQGDTAEGIGIREQMIALLERMKSISLTEQSTV